MVLIAISKETILSNYGVVVQCLYDETELQNFEFNQIYLYVFGSYNNLPIPLFSAISLLACADEPHCNISDNDSVDAISSRFF